MAVNRLSNARIQYDDGNGALASNYRLFFYAAGSSTKQNTYNSSAGSVANSNPIVLNALGEPGVEIWLTAGQSYKLGIAIPGTDDPPASFVWTEDNITGVNDTTSAVDQWKASQLTPTFVNATSFTFTGDQTTIFEVGRRLKSTTSGGTIYSTISASSFGAGLTTVTVVNDSGALDAGLSAVSYGILSNTHASIPGFRAKGDLLTQSAAGTIARFAVGANGTVPMARSADTNGLAYVAALNKAIYGLTYDNGTDAVNDLNINVGGAMDATGAYWMTLASALGKQSDVAWAVGGTTGTPLGGLDTGAVGNSDYYVWLIARSDTGVVDALYSLSSTAPTMPANYDFKRLIGWFKRVGGTVVAFHTYETEGGGIEQNWDVPTLDINLSNTLTTARRTDAVKVPLNFSTLANLTAHGDDATATVINIACPDQTDAAPSTTVAPLAQLVGIGAANVQAQLQIRTSATGTIASRATQTIDNYQVITTGFRWARRN